MKTVRTGIITGFGINADRELAAAFTMAGSTTEIIHINDLIRDPAMLEKMHILGFPGGFSYGDHIGSGLVFAHLCKGNLRSDLDHFLAAGKLVMGVCNGFQVLVKMGLLPNINKKWEPEVTLIHNDSGKFEDRWVNLQVNPQSPCLWTRGIASLECPVRHGEGKFVTGDRGILEKIIRDNLVTLVYAPRTTSSAFDLFTAVPYPANPNGSVNNIAGLTDISGRVLGLMPHPEAYLYPQNHPQWTRKKTSSALALFNNGVAYVKNQLL